MREFKVGDLVWNQESPFFGWLVTRIVGDGGVEVTNQSGSLRSTVRAEYIAPTPYEFKVGDLVKVDGESGTWTIVDSIGECVYKLQSGRAMMYEFADMLTHITAATEEIEWGPWVEGYLTEPQATCQIEMLNSKVRHRLPLPKPAPVVTVTEQWLRFGVLSGRLMDGDSGISGSFRAKVTRTTLDGKELDPKIEVLK